MTAVEFEGVALSDASYASEIYSTATMFGAPGAAVPNVFRQAGLSEKLCRDGVVTLPWLTCDEVDALAKAVAAVGAGVDYSDVHIPTNFRLSAFNNDADYKARLFDCVYLQLSAKIDEILDNYVPLVVNLFEKFPESGYDCVPIHQNPSFVEELKYKSVSLWIPLQDVSKENGTLGVLKGSHRRFYPMRAGNMPHHEIFAPAARALEAQHLKPLVARKGEVVVLDDSVIHWSFPNVSRVVRRAVQLIMVPRHAPRIYYHYNTSDDIPAMDLYEVDKNFFFTFNCNDRPEGLKKLTSVPFEYKAIALAEILGTADA